ncbi:CPBP family intramembrane glutamic endopeptidase [Thermoactinomyces sp. CICC 23799]|jgi:uncharacterized protein|uniref:CPBP family intramembrane glutamic endopeptidase n=1 Tax=Thermoactinomyces sp. CICC 23799 TaxID=2767429 RepID=UPI0018DE3A25|nr:CPBP family intramembrane glutamic endopeptidase [Thermoactinomyces sp. CICC 23799]MBH8600376.1 CPBP family intramembrane metalloprotease [Thermoactinomyces sp. CICC 23799]
MNEVIFNIINNLLFIGPLIVLFWLINHSEHTYSDSNIKGNILGFLCYLIVWTGYLAGFIIGLLLFFYSHAFLPWTQNFAADPYSVNTVKNVGMSLWIPSLIAMSFLLPPVRRFCTRFLRIHPGRRVHAVALSLSMLVFIQFFVTQSFGLESINEQTVPGDEAGTLSSIWSQDILFAILGLVGVGWLSRRSFKESLDRLGVKKITLKQAAIGISIGLIMLLAPIIAQSVAETLNWSENVQANELTDKMLGPLLSSVPGILTIGLAAALGEEMIFRGALLPRFGFVYTSLLFTLVHANYGFSFNSLVVLLLALVLGWARIRYNTTVCMIIHATYNISVSLLGG